MAKGMLIQRIHGRALPQRECVFSTINPIMTSETPSKHRESSITIPTMAGSTPA